MSYILHIDTNNKFEIDGKSASDVQAEIKEAGLIIGNVTLRRMMEGQLDSANGFELIQSLSQDEIDEQQQALDRAEADQVVVTTVGEVAEGNATATPEISVELEVSQPEGDSLANPAVVETEVVDAEATARAEEVRRRMLGESVATALAEVANPKDDEALASAQAVLDKKAQEMKPASSNEERKRRHTKREEMVDTARASQHGNLLAAIEAGVQPGVFLSYVNPDMRWFQFPITELADPENIHARTNTYIDLSPIVSGGWGFSLYVNGKSYTKRQKIKEIDSDSVVKAINEWLPTVLQEAKAAA